MKLKKIKMKDKIIKNKEVEKIILWNEFPPENEYNKNPELYQSHVLEQYKIYVEMADKISERRNLANVFFLTLHTALIGAIGFFFDKIELITPKLMITFPIAGIITLCFVWWSLIKSYRQLNTAKYEVIGEMEKRLPSSPYYTAEWKALGEGKDKSKYTPLTNVENWVPVIFGIMYFLIWAFVIFFN
jgi:hypothetical protein